MKMLGTVLVAGGLLLAAGATVQAQSPYYPAPRGYTAYRPQTAFYAPDAAFASRSACDYGRTVVARPSYSPVQSYYPVQQTAYYGEPHTACSVPTPAPVGVTVATPVVPARTTLPRGTVVGRGIIGQPTAYVQGQPLRNALRFLTF